LAGPVVGRLERSDLCYLGTVEWGLSDEEIRQVLTVALGTARASSAFTDLDRRSGVIWLEPASRKRESCSWRDGAGPRW
jgi:hypothetical protein